MAEIWIGNQEDIRHRKSLLVNEQIVAGESLTIGVSEKSAVNDPANRVGMAGSDMKVEAVSHLILRTNGNNRWTVLSTGALVDSNLGAQGSNKFVCNGSGYFLGNVEAYGANTGMILMSPNGTRYKVTVSNDGVLAVNPA